ncbi:hypothetical protein JD844_015877 [Phrynosoma platyrhinos]|uniref:Uncharacterized protein n=1 Tax=Phrynosoma platyrhinos TaxID=52577 RepID=A0ABQ7SJP1_PHRPL|nr:hypothetical protein JD844_015877 [Phrynosoma platyrhinos]
MYFQLYSVYLEGFLFCKVRYSQLHRWNEQVRHSHSLSFLFHYRCSFFVLEVYCYLKLVSVDPSITNSDVFISFFRKLQQVADLIC